MSNVLRNIPSVGELLESPPLKSLVSRVSRNVVVARVGQFLDDLRGQVQGATGVNIPTPADLAERIARWIAASERAGLRTAINATGVILHPDLGSPPLAAEAVAAITEVAGGYANVDLDLATGQPGQRSAAVAALLTRLTDAEAAEVFCSGAAAALAALAALAAGREVLVARGQVSRLGGSRLTDLLSASGAILREVGTTNEAAAGDYAAAVGERTAAILRPSCWDYKVVGARAEATIAELAALARRHNLPLIHDLGLGGLIDATKFSLADQPVARESIQAGADLVILSGERLLGGPACGVLLGRRQLIRKIQQHPLTAAMRADRLALAALAATLRLYDDPNLAERSVPLLSLLATPLENLQNRAERLAPQIAATGAATCEVVAGETSLAGESVPGQMLKTVCLSVTPKSGPASALAAALRQATPAIVGRISDTRLVLDLRSVPPSGDLPLVAAFESLPRVIAAPAAEAPQLEPL